MKRFSLTTQRDYVKPAGSIRRKCSSPGDGGCFAHRCLNTRGAGDFRVDPANQSGLYRLDHFHGREPYHDTHFGIGLSMHQRNAQTSDIVLREEEVVRIYDIFFDYSVLLDTDAFSARLLKLKSFRSRCPAEFHYRVRPLRT